MNVKEILYREPPSVLYHYTTQQGLLGILNNKEIWATHTQYLNDVREFRHALDLLKQELSSMASGAQDPSRKKFLRYLWQELARDIEDVNVCVCSFSADGDSLSQWRAYGGPPSGFAIGFSGEYLRRALEESGWLVPVLYEEDEQRLLVQTLVEDVIEEKRKALELKRPLPASGNLFAYLYRYAPILKDRSFRGEREWRIVTRPLNCTQERFCYRTGPSMVIPYFRLPLQGAESLGIQEIIVGPTPHTKQSIGAVKSLLAKHEIETREILSANAVNVKPSQVPYRNW